MFIKQKFLYLEIEVWWKLLKNGSLKTRILILLTSLPILRILLKFNGKFLQTQKQLALQGNKALFAMRSNVSQLMLSHCTFISLFDTYVLSILNYSCEIWGNHKGAELEKIHLNFLFKFWFRLLFTDNCILKHSYQWFVDHVNEYKLGKFYKNLGHLNYGVIKKI